MPPATHAPTGTPVVFRKAKVGPVVRRTATSAATGNVWKFTARAKAFYAGQKGAVCPVTHPDFVQLKGTGFITQQPV